MTELWAQLVADYGLERALGGTATRYWESGKQAWERARGLVPCTDCVLEYGAGAGRIAKAAVHDCKLLLLYEPCGAVRDLLQEELGTWASPQQEAVRVLSAADLDSLPALDMVCCINVLNHLSYEEVWSFAGFCSEAVSNDTRVLLHYRQNWGVGASVLHEGIASDWPMYLWDSAQLRAMFNAHGFRRLEHDEGDWAMDVMVRV